MRTSVAVRVFTISIMLAAIQPAFASWAKAADQPVPTLDQILQRFHDGVYVTLPNGGGRFLAKWQDEVRVGTASDRGAPVALARKLFDYLGAAAAFTQHRIVLTNQHVNFFVLFSDNLDADLNEYKPAFRRYFSSDAEYRAYYDRFKAEKAACNVKVSLSAQRAIVGVAAIVMVDANPEPAEKCLYNVAFVGMGFLGLIGSTEQVKAIPPPSKESALIDASALAILYRKEIQSGSTEATDRPLITKIYNDARHK